MSRLSLAILALLSFCLSGYAQTSAQVSNPTARKFDEFGDIQISDLKARLDNFAIQLQNEPATKGFILVYRSRRDLPGIGYRYAHRMRQYMIATRGIDETRVIAIDGGETDCLRQEFWIAPPGTAPKPRADAYQRNYTDFDSARKFDEISWGSDDEVAGVFPGELEAFADALRAEPRASAYVIAYSQYYVQRGSYEENGKQKPYLQKYRDPRGPSQRVLTQVSHHLREEFHIPASRIHSIDGGFRKWGAVELWIVPRGEHS